MTSEKFDVVILGGGNAGMGVTIPTRAAGLSVAMVEARDLGGTCPNRGCTPKKILVAAAHMLHEIERAGEHRISVGRPDLDWAQLIRRQKEMIEGIPDRLADLMEKRGVEVIRGKASFVGSNSVQVGDRALEARHIVIATGARPRRLAFPGAEHLTTSDDVLNDPTLPGAVVFVGGGVIALELGHVYRRAGANVTILEALPELLAGVDAGAVEQIRRESERVGLVVHTATTVNQIERTDDRFRVVFSQGEVARTITADRVVNCAGRVADVDMLDLHAAGIDNHQGRIAVDDYLRSMSNPNVHVCGDAVWNTPQLSPVATYEGRIVGRNIVDGPKHKPNYVGVPSCVYTIPAVASVGLTEAAASAKGLKVKVHVNDMLGWLSARSYAETVAWSKVIVDADTEQIVGAHIVGHAGEELINVFALAMKHGITARQLSDGIFSFPTFSSDIKNMF
jgi:glutathione reductase (NADPH)